MCSSDSFRRFIVVVAADFVYSLARCWRKSALSTSGQENRILLPSRIAGIRPFLM
jgi:hypothetical protein